MSLAAVLGVAVGGVFVYRAIKNRGSEDAEYQTAPVQRGRVAAQVTATGTLSPLVTVQVGSQVSGRIQELHADFNSKVTKGQVIAKIDPQLIESEVARARANLTAAAAQVTRAQAEMRDAKQKADRARAMAAQGLIARAEQDSAEATHDAAAAGVVAARAAMSQSRASLKQTETNLTYTTIVSPIDGVVISRNVDVGQTVAASLQAPTLFTIAEDLAKMEVHTSVAESDVGNLKPGMPVEFTVDAFPTERFKGTVKQVRFSPQTVSNVVTYDAVVEVANAELKLRPGMTADVTFVIEEREDVLTVPNAALRFRPPPEVLASLGLTEEELSPRSRGPSGDGEPSRGRRSRGGASEMAPAAAKAAPGGGEAPAPPAGSSPSPSPSTSTEREGKEGREGREGREPRERNRRMVWKLGKDGVLALARVRIGISDGRQTEILDGELAEGDVVVTGIAGATPTPSQDQQRGGAGGQRRRPPGFL